MSGIAKVRRLIGDNIRTLRKEAGFSQEVLAERAELHPVYLSQVECGKKAASVEDLWRISKALKKPMPTFFQGI